MIEWDADGYPTKQSLRRLHQELRQTDVRRAIGAFYQALRPGPYGRAGPESVEVRGDVLKLWSYHTEGWLGCEFIVEVLSRSRFWRMLLERQDRGGHYYFIPPEDSRRWLDDMLGPDEEAQTDAQ